MKILKILIRLIMVCVAIAYWLFPDLIPGFIDDAAIAALMAWLQGKIK